MNVIVIGGGKVGRRLVEDFDREGHNVVLIETKEEIVENIQDTYDVMALNGSGTSVEILKEAGIRHCDMAICVTDKDEINALCGIIAKKLGAKTCIARIRNRRYFNQIAFMRDELGINLIVNPEFSAANEISRMIRFPAAIKTETFANGRIELAEVKLPLELVDKAICEIYKLYKVRILICAVARDDDVIIPNGDFVLQKGDKIYITASHSELSKFMKLANMDSMRLKSAMLIGGGRISYYLAMHLIESGMRVKIVEADRQKCLDLAEYIPKATVIHGDGTDRDLLDDEGIDSIDALVSLTGIDEENIVISLYAKHKGVNKVITKVNRLSFAQMIDTIGIDSVVTPKDITANIIIGYARAMNEADEEPEVISLYRIVNNKAEAVEFRVSHESALTQRMLKDINLKRNMLIAAVARDNKTFIPDGGTQLTVGDIVVVVTKKKLKQLTDILA